MKVSNNLHAFLGILAVLMGAGLFAAAEERPAPGSGEVPAYPDEEDITPEMPELPEDPEIRGRTAFFRLWYDADEVEEPLSLFLIDEGANQFFTLGSEVQGTLLANYREIPAGQHKILAIPSSLLSGLPDKMALADLERLIEEKSLEEGLIDFDAPVMSHQTLLVRHTAEGVVSSLIDDATGSRGRKRIRAINLASEYSPEINLLDGQRVIPVFTGLQDNLLEKNLGSGTDRLTVQLACRMTPDFVARLNMEVSLKGVQSCTAVVFRNRYDQLDFLVTRDARDF